MADSQAQQPELPEDRGAGRPAGDGAWGPPPPAEPRSPFGPPAVPPGDKAAGDEESEGEAATGAGVRWIVVAAVALCILALFFFWQRGCRPAPPQAEDEITDPEKAKEAKLLKEKPEFEDLVCLGTEPNAAKRDRVWPVVCKPGHWTAVSLSTKANRQDVDGRVDLRLKGRDGADVRLASEQFTLWTSQPAVLPKGQDRTLEAFLFVPQGSRPTSLDAQLRHRVMGHLLQPGNAPVTIVQNYQYQCVVLARTPSRYSFLRDLPSFGSPTDLRFNEESRRFYRLVLLDGERASRLPPYALYWTGIAYLFWDGADPEQLTKEQQTALVDWLHWGGQMVLSGPDSLEALRGSFLEPYLPVAATGQCKLTAAELAPLSDYWGRMPGDATARGAFGEPEFIPLAPLQPWPGVTWRILPEARELPYTGGMLAERRVGRGRVVASRFHLSGRDLSLWPRVDGWVNGCLLRRPPRQFILNANEGDLATHWLSPPQAAVNPKITSSLRYLSRDAAVSEFAASHGRANSAGSSAARRSAFAVDGSDGLELEDTTRGYLPEAAAWTDAGEVAGLAGDTLRNSSRIQVPSAKFVVWALVVYLIVLVPVNWAVFRTVRRVEWAWAAAPILALVATVIVVRMAQLDIGFARAQTEVCLIEMHAGHARAHVTRYTALYASLYTRYRVAFTDAGAQVQPFAGARQEARWETMPLELRYLSGSSDGDEMELRGFNVDSNSTRFLHSEQMCDVGGEFKCSHNADGSYQVTNRSDLAVRKAVLVHAVDKYQYRTARDVDIPAGATVTVRFDAPQDMPAPPKSPRTPRGGEAARETQTPTDKSALLDLSSLRDDVAHPARCEPGEIRLVSVLDQEIAGQRIAPAAPQIRRAGVLVAHLGFDFGEDPKRDQNTPTMVDPTFRRAQPGDTGANPPARRNVASLSGPAR